MARIAVGDAFVSTICGDDCENAGACKVVAACNRTDGVYDLSIYVAVQNKAFDVALQRRFQNARISRRQKQNNLDFGPLPQPLCDAVMPMKFQPLGRETDHVGSSGHGFGQLEASSVDSDNPDVCAR